MTGGKIGLRANGGKGIANGIARVNDVFYLLRRFDKVRAGGSVSATLVRWMAVESGGSVLRAANPGRPAWR